MLLKAPDLLYVCVCVCVWSQSLHRRTTGQVKPKYRRRTKWEVASRDNSTQYKVVLMKTVWQARRNKPMEQNVDWEMDQE